MSLPDTEYVVRLQQFLNNLLRRIIKDDAERFKYIDEKHMLTWIKAFTHETVSIDFNYEELEFIGDAVLKAAFPLYLTARFPHAHKDQYTNLNTIHMRGVAQGQYAQELGLVEFIRLPENLRGAIKVSGDIYESFFGALYTVAESVYKNTGQVLVYNMVASLFNTKPLDINAQGSVQTVVDQLFSRFDRGYKLDAVVSETPNQVRYEVRLTPAILSFLQLNGINIQKLPVPLGLGLARSKREASEIAYTSALQALESVGVTYDWAAERKHQADFNSPQVLAQVKDLTAKLNREGFQSATFQAPAKTNVADYRIITLLGYRADGSRQILSTVVTTDRKANMDDIRAQLIRQYLQS